MLCGTDSILRKILHIHYEYDGILLVPHNIIMNLDNVMGTNEERKLLYTSLPPTDPS